MIGDNFWPPARETPETEDIATNWLPSVKILGQIKYAVTRARLGAFRVGVSGPDTKDAFQADFDERIAAVDKLSKEYVLLISSPEEKQIWATFAAKWAAYLDQQKKVIKVGASEFAKADEATSRPMFDEALVALDADIDLNNAGAANATASASTNYNEACYLSSAASRLPLVLPRSCSSSSGLPRR